MRMIAGWAGERSALKSSMGATATHMIGFDAKRQTTSEAK